MVRGRVFRWMVKGGKGRLHMTSSRFLQLSVQEETDSPGCVARFFLTSVEWTSEHEENLDCAPFHKVSLFPRDVMTLVEAALDAGWNPSEPGGPVSFGGFSGLRDYVVASVCQECGLSFRHRPECRMLEVQRIMTS